MREAFLTLARPWFLLFLLPFLLALAVFWFRKGPSIVLPSLAVFKSVPGAGKKGYRSWIPLLCFLFAAVMMVIALARPREGLEQIRRRAEGVDIIIALDLSGSMRTIDCPSGISSGELESGLRSGKIGDRLKTARSEIIKFINARPNDRIGLIAFSHQPYTVCPPTLDHAWLIANLNQLKPGITSDRDDNPLKYSTNLAAPLASAVRKLKDTDSARKVIVFFTDGVNNVNAGITPLQAAVLAKAFDITVYTVGIGSDVSLAPVQTPFGTRLQRVQSGFDEPLLKEIAGTTSGHYYHAEDAESMSKAMKAIDKLEKTSFEQQTLINWRELAPYFLIASLIFLLAGFIMENTLFLKAP